MEGGLSAIVTLQGVPSRGILLRVPMANIHQTGSREHYCLNSVKKNTASFLPAVDSGQRALSLTTVTVLYKRANKRVNYSPSKTIKLLKVHSRSNKCYILDFYIRSLLHQTILTCHFIFFTAVVHVTL